MKLYVILSIFLTVACSHKNKAIQLQNGDLLFTGTEAQIETSDFSDAINSVTQTDRATNFIHIGIIEINNNGTWVIHASPQKGVCRDSLETFIKKEKQISVYRLKSDYINFIPQALEKSRQYLGQPYDYSYLINDSTQYCSGLIYNLFENSGIFQLKPMTFKDISGKFHPFWIEHYKKLNMEIPENKPGCNPNEMAASSAIYFLNISLR